jgi:hypothetical protein
MSIKSTNKLNSTSSLGRGLDPEDFYISPQGFLVFTEQHHLKRGYCCTNGCKHCPYKKIQKSLKQITEFPKE